MSIASRRRRPTVFPEDKAHARNTHSAIFAEVKVDQEIGVVRVTAWSARSRRRILNLKTAHSQVMGSVVWGIGMALHEETVFDHGSDRIVNAKHRRIPCAGKRRRARYQGHLRRRTRRGRQSAWRQGLGEIWHRRRRAAIANAIYHATGKRIRDLPITLDKLRLFA